MTTKKDLVIAILCTFCLTATLFTIIPTRSSTTNSREYDPWTDISGDGIIDYLDISISARLFGTTGDPTRNINVTNFPLDGEGNLRVRQATEPLQTYKDCVEISVLDASRVKDGTEHGVCVCCCSYRFCFAPKQTFLNVTKFAVSMVLYNETTGWQRNYFNMQMNGQTVFAGGYKLYYEQISYYPMFFGTETSDPSNCTFVKPGINYLTTDFNAPPTSPVFILQITIFIEYNYLG
jgi:hypothetical protein